LQNTVYMYKENYIILRLYLIDYIDRLYRNDNKFFNLARLVQ